MGNLQIPNQIINNQLLKEIQVAFRGIKDTKKQEIHFEQLNVRVKKYINIEDFRKKYESIIFKV